MMQPLRQRAVCIARRVRPTTGLRSARSYASKSDSAHHSAHHSHGHGNESMGTAFYIAAGTVPLAVVVYAMAQPGPDGEPPALTKYIAHMSDFGEQWEVRNTLRTVAIEQAAHDKHLLYYAGRNQHIELKFPEVFQSGSPHSVPAGHAINLDKVISRYRKQHLDEEERKAQKIAAAKSQD